MDFDRIDLRFHRGPGGWTVIDDNRYDGPESLYIGVGATQGEALIELLEFYDDGRLVDEIERALL